MARPRNRFSMFVWFRAAFLRRSLIIVKLKYKIQWIIIIFKFKNKTYFYQWTWRRHRNIKYFWNSFLWRIWSSQRGKQRRCWSRKRRFQKAKINILKMKWDLNKIFKFLFLNSNHFSWRNRLIPMSKRLEFIITIG